MGSLSDAGKRMKEKGTVGKFSAKAKSAGMSTQSLARKDAHKGGKLGKEANFAKMAGRHWKPLGKS